MARNVPYAEYETTVGAEMIDYSGHLNVGYYLVIFEEAARSFFGYLDLSRAYRERTNHALFAVEAHLTFEHEVCQGDRLRLESQLLGSTPKAIDVVHYMRRLPGGELTATNEVLYLHIDLGTRRSAPMPARHQSRLSETEADHSALGVPPQAGRRISLRREIRTA
jgi:acyl-CoA thioester hydrolase